MNIQLRCNHILITGGGSGIGRAIAKRMIAGGASVTIFGRTKEKLEQVKTEINSEKLFIMAGDLTDFDKIPDYLSEASRLMGGIDGVVNNAGVGTSAVTGRGYEPWNITPEEWDRVMSVDLKAAFFVMRDAVDHMLSNGTKGNILNISSNAACMDIIGSYGSAKLSLLKMTRAFGKKYGHNGIIINGIAPGATATPMISRYCNDENAPYPRHAIERFIKPYEIAELAAYLMSNFGEIICGHTVVADGGDNAATL